MTKVYTEQSRFQKHKLKLKKKRRQWHGISPCSLGRF